MAVVQEIGNLVELLRLRARHQPDQVAFRYLRDGSTEEANVTCKQMDARARRIAQRLRHEGASGERVLLLHSSSLEFIVAFFGCLYAGAVAVPAYPPRSKATWPRLQAIIEDARARFALSTGADIEATRASLKDVTHSGSLRWLASDQVSPIDVPWQYPQLDADSLAVLQYTSGSTSVPKGVMLTHGNLVHNLEGIRIACDARLGCDTSVSWLPIHHDMGLIGGVLAPLYSGGFGVLMSPAAFLQRPLRWLEAISRFRATIVTAPNFAFDLCVDSSLPQGRAGLDLSCLRVAFCGAETVRPATLKRFAEAFAPHGFRYEAFHPCYGLAEAALMVSGQPDAVGPIIDRLSIRGLQTDKVLDPKSAADETSLVRCGRPAQGHKVIIVDPQTLRWCLPGQIGEIWVSSPSVAQGYWSKPTETAETFRARVADTGEGPFLRTGDLGYLQDGQLVVTGRLKDLIIIRGRNYYPEDLEAAVQRSSQALQQGRGAIFSIDRGGAERLVIIQEVDRRRYRGLKVEQLIAAIRQRIAETYELEVDTVVLAKPWAIPTTSSGKIQRSACREAFLSDRLASIGKWQAPEPQRPLSNTPDNSTLGNIQPLLAPPNTNEIRAWLISHLATTLGLSPDEMDASRPFAYFGLDSVRAVQMAGQLQAWLRRELPVTLAYEYPTIEKLARHLADESQARPASDAAKNGRTAEAIAIIGIGCRFPGATGPLAFWRLLCDGVDAIAEVPTQRWDLHAFYDPDPTAPGKMSTVWGGFLQQIDRFDPQFFGISPREAARMDPQQRLLLEVGWEAFEDAGLVPERLAGSRTGVFVGISTNDYGQQQIGDPALSDPYAGTGNALSIAANRLSYQFDFRGPSMAVDTACSSSLVAVHLACRSLRQGDCTLAVAAGVNIILSPAMTVNFTKAGFMAPDGRCKAFDARANGYVRGEGAGAVILKPLSSALADRDTILAVILGSAVNNDGRTNGLTAPSREGQESVLIEAYREAGRSPGRVQYIETHGTGTALGDPVEATALGNVLSVDRPRGDYCALGSVKTNIGHLEAAAGIAGLIKVVLSLAHRKIPPSLHFQSPNPYIPFDDLPLRVQQTCAEWPGGDQVPLSGVSSFGFGGTNAHVVLEAAPPLASDASGDSAAADQRCHLMPLSAQSPEGLRALARAYMEFLAPEGDGADIMLRDLCYSASERRSHFGHRLALLVRSREDAVAGLEAFVRSEKRAGVATGRKASTGRGKLAFVFSGQGSQWRAMGRELFEREPVYREEFLRCDEHLRAHTGWSLLDEIMADEPNSRLAETAVAQPTLFALQTALAALWRSWGIEPDAVVGHSVGEIAAARAAGIVDLPDAIRLVFHRSRLMQRAARSGRMVAVRLSFEEATKAIIGCEDVLSVAAVNSPRSCTLSGEGRALARLVETLRQKDTACRWLPLEYPFHSPQMESYRSELVHALRDLQPRKAELTMYSTVTGRVSNGLDLKADYWGEQIRAPVQFAPVIESLAQEGYTFFLEIGPHPVHATAILECLHTLRHQGLVLPSLREGEGASAALLASLGVLYSQGFEIEWSRLSTKGSQYVKLPSYRWQRQRCWSLPDDVRRQNGSGHAGAETHPLLGRHIGLAQPAGAHLWELELDRRSLAYLDDHRIQGLPLFPVSAYLEMALAAGAQVLGSTACVLTETSLEQALVLPDDNTQIVQTILLPVNDREAVFQVYSRPADGDRHARSWTLHARSRVQRMSDA